MEIGNIEPEICNIRVRFWHHIYVAHHELVWQLGIPLQFGDA